MTEIAGKEIKEIEPRARVLIIDVQPVLKQNVRISQELFGKDADSIEKFAQLAITSIKSPKAEKKLSTLEREEASKLYLPESVEDFAAIVITGSPFTARPREKGGKLFIAEWKNELLQFIHAAYEHKIPILGICFGEQALAEALGGKVVQMRSKEGEYVKERAWGKIKRAPGSVNDPVMKGLPSEFIAPESHEDVVARLPEGAILLAENSYGVQGFRIGDAWGFEFHPERKPERVEKFLADEKNIDEIQKSGINPAEMQERGKQYDKNLRKIFSNFLKFAWSGLQ